MDPTQRIDPNRTMMVGGDPLRTQAIPAMAGAKALTATVVPGREVAMANGPAREQFLLQFQAMGGDAQMGGGRTPLNLVLVIDRSGSMEGTPLEYVRHACSYVVDLLTPTDILSVVTFEEFVEVLLPPQRVTDKAMVKERIATIQPGNTTNLYEGLSIGAGQALHTKEGNRATRMVVLSDGDPTAGVQDFPSLVNLAGEMKRQGITLTFLGFGPDYNEELLAGMAKRAGGNYYYIPRPELIPEIFRSELDKLMTVVARNLTLEIKTARWTTLRQTQGQATSPGEREFSFPLSDIERGSSVQRILDFEFPNHPLGWYRIADAKLRYDDLVTGKTETLPMDLVLEFTADAARYSVSQNSMVAGAVQLDVASRVVEKTLMGLKTQQLSAAGAVAELEKTQSLLLSQGRTAEAQEVTLALRAIKSGDTGGAEKTLIGTMLHLDQGKQ